jgi:serine/threonine-protein kinase OSR1/STK39
MKMSNHKNIVKEYTSFIYNHYLWIVMPLIDAGSVDFIMRYCCEQNSPGIKDEKIIATILKETLEGLNYLHMANDSEGEIFLGDYGVSESIRLSKS